MTIQNISFLGQSQVQQNSLKTLNSDLADLQRQLYTQKKTDNYGDLGVERTRVQRFRADADRAESFIKSLTTIETNITLSSNALLQIEDIARTSLEGLSIQTRQGGVDIETINTIAKDGLSFIEDLLNFEHDGNFLFAGTDSSNKPFDNRTALDIGFQSEIANWLNGTQNTTSLLANVQATTGTDLGYSSTLQTAEQKTIRADTNIEIKYGVHADEGGLDDIVRNMALLANLKFPDAATDVATEDDFHEILNNIITELSTALGDLSSSNFSLSSKLSRVDNISEKHQQDVFLFGGLVSDIEDADIAEVITRIKGLEVQLNASYQITSIVSQLSLVNFI